MNGFFRARIAVPALFAVTMLFPGGAQARIGAKFCLQERLYDFSSAGVHTACFDNPGLCDPKDIERIDSWKPYFVPITSTALIAAGILGISLGVCGNQLGNCSDGWRYIGYTSAGVSVLGFMGVLGPVLASDSAIGDWLKHVGGHID